MTHKGRERKLSVTLGEEHKPDGTVRLFREYRRGTRLIRRIYTLSEMNTYAAPGSHQGLLEAKAKLRDLLEKRL